MDYEGTKASQSCSPVQELLSKLIKLQEEAFIVYEQLEKAVSIGLVDSITVPTNATLSAAVNQKSQTSALEDKLQSMCDSQMYLIKKMNDALGRCHL